MKTYPELTRLDLLTVREIGSDDYHGAIPNPCAHVLETGKRKGQLCPHWGAIEIGGKRYCETHALPRLLFVISLVQTTPDAIVLPDTKRFTSLSDALEDGRIRITVAGGMYEEHDLPKA